MTSEATPSVFLDADVLAAPVTRSRVLIAAQEDDPPFQVRWSRSVEEEADRHMRPGQRFVSEIRERFDWGTQALVPAVDPSRSPKLEDTDAKDRHVVAVAHAAGIGVIVTRNVRHFGRKDLAALSLSAVDPDWFLAVTLTDRVYAATLEDICSARRRDPRTPQSLHGVLASEHPRLFDAMRNVFPGAQSAHAGSRQVAEPFRGVRCIACGVRTHDAIEDAGGLCRACGQ